MTNHPHISVITPVYGCKTCLVELYLRLKNTLEEINPDFDIIMVNDASPDGAWEAIVELAKKDVRVKGINLSRNFGQHYAITAGLDFAKSEWVVVMDCDLQDQPEEITKLYIKAQEGYDVVLACRTNRQDSFIKRQGSHYFYKILAYLTETKQNSEVANFGIYNKKVIHAILSMNDKIKYFPAMVKWVGFRQTELSVKHAERSSGESSYNFKRLLKLAMNTVMSFSDKPLRLVVNFGTALSLLALCFAILTLIRYCLGYISSPGYTSLIISIWFLSGVIITVTGMVGLYIGRTFEQVKNRPVFIVSETINTIDR